MDGTLLDTVEDLAAAVNFSRSKEGLEALPPETIASYVGNGADILLERSFKGSDVDLNKAYNNFASYYTEHCDDFTKPYPNVMETLQKINCIKAIVTNKPEKFAIQLAKDLNMAKEFDVIIGSDTLEDIKPNQISIKFLSQKYGIDTSEMLVIGDHYTDIELGINGKVKSVFCNFGIGNLQGLKSYYTVDSFKDILKIPGIPQH